MPDCPQSTPTPAPPPLHPLKPADRPVYTPPPLRASVLSYLATDKAYAAQDLAQHYLDLLFDSDEVVHDPWARLRGVSEDVDAARSTLDEMELPPGILGGELRYEIRWWAETLHLIKETMQTRLKAIVEEMEE